MATRKNLKKTGKPRRGGAKTGRIEKAKRMYSRNNPLLQSKASEFPSSEKFFSSYTPEYEKLYIETPAFRKNITTYVLDLPKKQFKEKLWFLMEKDIIDVKTMNGHKNQVTRLKVNYKYVLGKQIIIYLTKNIIIP